MSHSPRDPAQSTLEIEVRTACEAGDYASAVTQLVDELGASVFAFLRHRLQDEGDAAEVFSMFSEDLWRGLSGFQWRCTVRGFCFVLARAAAARFRARANERPERRMPLSHAPASRLVDPVREKTLPYLQTENKQRLQVLFQQLSADERELLQLRLDQRLGFRELAMVFGLCEANASQAELTRAAALLRKRFQLIKGRLRRLACEDGLVEGTTESLSG